MIKASGCSWQVKVKAHRKHCVCFRKQWVCFCISWLPPHLLQWDDSVNESTLTPKKDRLEGFYLFLKYEVVPISCFVKMVNVQFPSCPQRCSHLPSSHLCHAVLSMLCQWMMMRSATDQIPLLGYFPVSPVEMMSLLGWAQMTDVFRYPLGSTEVVLGLYPFSVRGSGYYIGYSACHWP